MSAFIGSVKGLNHNSPNDFVAVWCSVGGVELHSNVSHPDRLIFDPIAARNFAALLVRASEEVERMRARAAANESPDGDADEKNG